MLFAGLQSLAVVEAKRKHKDVMGVIPQAKRYSDGYVVRGDEVLPEGSPWGKHRVPFLFATNGHPFLRQLRTKSGIWFLDARRPENHPAPLEGWYTPEGLIDRISLEKVQLDLAQAGLGRRFGWLVDSTLEAVRCELRDGPGRPWRGSYLRAEVVLSAFPQATAPDRRRTRASPPDILDKGIRSRETLEEVIAARSEQARRWNIVTELGPEAFVAALRESRVARA